MSRMRILVTTVDWIGDQADVWVVAEPSVPAGSLLDELDRSSGGGPWWCRDRLVSADGPLGYEVTDGATLTHAAPQPPAGAAAPTSVELRLVAGPGTGRRWRLGPGTYRVGRSPEADVDLVADPRVSRRHAVFTVSEAGVHVRDEGSTYGIQVEAQPIVDGPLPPGALLEVGDSVLEWVPSGSSAVTVVADGEGGLMFNRPPRIIPPEPPPTVRFPGEPPQHQRVSFPLMAAAAPALLGVVLAMVLHQLQFLLFTLLSPVMGVSNYVSQRRGGVKSSRERKRAYDRAVERAREALSEAMAVETETRRRAFPDQGALGQRG